MAWIYLAESEATHLASEMLSKPSPTVSMTNTLSLSSYHACRTEASNQRRFGMTSQHLTATCLTSPLISSLPDSHARTLALRERVRDWKESEADFFLKSCAWPKKSSPHSYSLKMSQPSDYEAWIQLSKNLPKQGMIVAGVCYPLRMLEHDTKEKDGFYWPTTTATDAKQSRNLTVRNRQSSGHSGMTLTDFITLYPTATSRDWKSGSKEKKTNSHPLSEYIGGALNPLWVEWLMGFPLMWSKADGVILAQITGKTSRKMCHESQKKKNNGRSV